MKAEFKFSNDDLRALIFLVVLFAEWAVIYIGGLAGGLTFFAKGAIPFLVEALSIMPLPIFVLIPFILMFLVIAKAWSCIIEPEFYLSWCNIILILVIMPLVVCMNFTVLTAARMMFSPLWASFKGIP